MQNNGDPEVASTVKFHAIKVKVTPTGPGTNPGEILCDVSPVGHGSGSGNSWKVEHNKIKLGETEGPFCIQFVLDNELEWDSDPMWVKVGACPPDEPHYEPEQVWIDKTPQRRVLTIMNMNVGEPCDLYYRMNFADGRFCDPIIENSGGNVFRS